MGLRRTLTDRLRNRLGLGVALTGLAAGMVAAQPTPPAPQAPVEAPSAPPAKAPSEPAPAAVAPAEPTPTVPPDVKDIVPAPPPKEQVTEKPAPAPMRRERYDIAVLQALDKVTAETLRFEAPVGRPVRWKGLIFTVQACERSAPDEAIDDSMVYLTIDAQPRPQPGRPTLPPRRAFRGWMFAASPGLNPVQHATYDAWAISCRASAPLTPVVAPRARPPAVAPAAEPEPKLLVLPAAKPAAATVELKAAPEAKAPAPKAPAPEPKPAPASPPTSP